jgi:hypothetical protein
MRIGALLIAVVVACASPSDVYRGAPRGGDTSWKWLYRESPYQVGGQYDEAGIFHPDEQTDSMRIDLLEENANDCCVEPRVTLIVNGKKFVQGEDIRQWLDAQFRGAKR